MAWPCPGHSIRYQSSWSRGARPLGYLAQGRLAVPMASGWNSQNCPCAQAPSGSCAQGRLATMRACPMAHCMESEPASPSNPYSGHLPYNTENFPMPVGQLGAQAHSHSAYMRLDCPCSLNELCHGGCRYEHTRRARVACRPYAADPNLIRISTPRPLTKHARCLQWPSLVGCICSSSQ